MTKLGIKRINSIARELNTNHDRLLKYIKIQELCQELLELLEISGKLVTDTLADSLE